jgi:NADPH:quinone reductase-like Zn-dependent oxidoreductase
VEHLGFDVIGEIDDPGELGDVGERSRAGEAERIMYRRARRQSRVERREDGMNGKVVVITGASGGIGAAAASSIASRGASVVLVARRETELRAVAERYG